MTFSEHTADMKNIASCIGTMKVDVSADMGTVVDESKVEWYRERFEMFIADGVPAAINSYLKHLLKEDVNNLTRAVIIQLSNDMLYN